MKTISNYIKHWLVPPFLQRLDDYLLDNYPDVWRTRGHYVLFYSLSAIVLLFLAGMAFPVSVTDLTVDPIAPIRFVEEGKYLYPSGTLVLLGILFWIRNQYQLKNGASSWKDTLRILLVYGICFFFLVGCMSVAFRMGTIVRTAWGLMDQKDIDYLEENDFFVYGFVPIEGDTSLIMKESEFKKREADFKKTCLNENNILKNRYDTPYLLDLKERLFINADTSFYSTKSLLKKIDIPVEFLDLWHLKELSYESYRLSRKDRAGWRDNNSESYLSYLREFSMTYSFSFWTDGALLSFLSDMTNLSNRLKSNITTTKPYVYKVNWREILRQSYRTKKSFLSNLSDMENNIKLDELGLSDEGDLLENYYLRILQDLAGLSLYNDYYIAETYKKIDKTLIEKYEAVSYDTVYLDTLRKENFLIPKAPLQLENGVRSVQHARQFLSEWIIYRFWKKYVFPILPLLAFILFMVRYFSFKGLSIFLILYMLSSMAFNIFFEGNDTWKLNTLFDKAHLFFLVGAPILADISLFKKKRYWFASMGYELMLFILAALTIFTLIPNQELTGEETTLYVAYAVGLVMALMMPSIEALPKSE